MSSLPDVPALVNTALRQSLSQGYLHATRSETGRLLATLAATCTGTIAECGTGCGVGAAWLRTGAPAETSVVTAESDPTLASAASSMFADHGIEVLQADWTELQARAPFSLIFLDASSAKESDRDEIIDLVSPGGYIVLDDFTPSTSWPPMVDHRVDQLRLQWLTDPRLTATEVMVASDTAVVVAVRRRD